MFEYVWYCITGVVTRRSPEDVLGSKAFDFYFDEEGNVFTRAEGTLFKRQHPHKVDATQPLWATVQLTCGNPSGGGDFAIEINSWKYDNNRLGTSANNREVGDASSPCVICFDAPKDLAFIPCGHKCVCPSCADHYDEENGCPICRRPVVDVLRIYS